MVRFLVRLSNNNGYRPEDCGRLTNLAYSLVRPFNADVGNLRVSSSAVELDLLADSKVDVRRVLSTLEKIGTLLGSRDLSASEPAGGDSELISMGLNLFNGERYWESHEALEVVWKRSREPARSILQGIILIAAALVHLQKNERDVTVSILRRACGKFENFSGRYFGIDIQELKAKIERMALSGQPSFFKIEFQSTG